MFPKRILFPLIAFALFGGTGIAQEKGSQPIYRVLIVSRTTKAINYGHRSEPTRIDFKGTEILPQAHGEAVVQSKDGSVQINAKFDHVPPPARFGPQYLTYVVWAISPDGKPQNLGELVLNGSDKGKLTVATPMQAFALIVTAEPYFSVSQPSNAVVMENAVRPDTSGKVEEVDAKYELLPRQEFTYEPGKEPPMGPAVSMKEYEATVAIYQAQNAIQLAKSAGADRYAGDEIRRAQDLLDQAQTYKKDSKEAVSTAREAAQVAEDARVITERKIASEEAPRTSARRENP